LETIEEMEEEEKNNSSSSEWEDINDLASIPEEKNLRLKRFLSSDENHSGQKTTRTLFRRKLT